MEPDRIISLWAGKDWPPPIRGYLFLPEAFNRIGRMLYGIEWQDDYASYDLLPMPPESPSAAPRGMRFEAHEYLEELAGEENDIGYETDYEEDPPPAQPEFSYQGSLAGLGRVQPGALQALAQGTSTPATPVRRPPGFHFSQAHWRLYRERFARFNAEIQPVIDKVGAATHWLFDEAFAGTIVPFVMHAIKGGDSQLTTRDDWLMPLIERRRRRIQTCRLVPGQPAWPDGSHWIFINAAELTKAMQAYEVPGDMGPPPNAPSSLPKREETEIPTLIAAAAARKPPRETRSGNVHAALVETFGATYLLDPRPDWNLILDAIARWEKANKDKKLPPTDEARRRATYHLFERALSR
jgi:hypothetical protein